jgi:pyrroline-5-carboxylate reductase
MRICILGCGNMGGSLARGLARGGAISPNQILLFDHNGGKAALLARKTGAKAAKSASEAASRSDAVIIAVKPFAVEELLASLRDGLGNKLVISIAAGITTSFIEKRTPRSCRVAVAMPNLAFGEGKGACLYFMGKRASRADAALLGKLFSSAGMAQRVAREGELVRAYISGSGIAFFFPAIEGLALAGMRKGMGRREALALAAAAAEGAGALAMGKEPAELASMVATKKGTTVEGLKVLQKAGMKKAFMRAALASMRKAERMARKK